jgi:hypothetical protein
MFAAKLKHKTPTESVELADIIENQFDALQKNITKLIQKYMFRMSN